MPSSGLAQNRPFHIQRLCATTSSHRRHHRESCSGRHRRAKSSFDLSPTNILRESHPSMHKPAHLADYLACRLGRPLRQPRRDLVSRKYCNLPNELRRQVAPKFRLKQQFESSCAKTPRFEHLSAALKHQILCATPANPASRARQDGFLFFRTAQVKDRQLESLCEQPVMMMP